MCIVCCSVKIKTIHFALHVALHIRLYRIRGLTNVLLAPALCLSYFDSRPALDFVILIIKVLLSHHGFGQREKRTIYATTFEVFDKSCLKFEFQRIITFEM